MQRKEVEVRWLSRERQQQYQWLEVELGSVKSLKHSYHLPIKLGEGNILQASVILSMGAMYALPPYCWQVDDMHPTAMLSCLN